MVQAGECILDASRREQTDWTRSGLATFEAPRVVYETKVVLPEAPEVASPLPFRLMHHADEGPAAVGKAGYPSVPAPDMAQQRTDRGRRRRGQSRASR